MVANDVLLALGLVVDMVSCALYCFQICVNKSAKGISLKSLELYLIASILRLTDFSWFDTAVRLYLIYAVRSSPTYAKDLDSLPHWRYLWYLACMCVVFVCINPQLDIGKLLFNCNYFVLILAIQALITTVRNSGELDSLTCHYVSTLALSRILVTANLALAKGTLMIPLEMILSAAAIVQTYMLKDFFLQYCDRFLRFGRR